MDNHSSFDPIYFRAIGHGDTHPISFGNSSESMARNRRIEIVVKTKTIVGAPINQLNKNIPLEPYLFQDKFPIPEEDFIPEKEEETSNQHSGEENH